MKRSDLKTELGAFTVQWLEEAPGLCLGCDQEVGWGPIGYSVDDPSGPLCDGCMLDRNPGLGMLLMIANANRELAQQAAEAGDSERADSYMVALMTVARMYDKGANWPARSVGAKGVVASLEEKVRQVLMHMLTGATN